jgi:hypothetical protein
VETTAVSILRGPQIADAARELEIGTEQFGRSVRQDEDDRGERDNGLISKLHKETRS